MFYDFYHICWKLKVACDSDSRVSEFGVWSFFKTSQTSQRPAKDQPKTSQRPAKDRRDQPDQPDRRKTSERPAKDQPDRRKTSERPAKDQPDRRKTSERPARPAKDQRKKNPGAAGLAGLVYITRLVWLDLEILCNIIHRWSGWTCVHHTAGLAGLGNTL